jgi:hypothetical protein
VGILRAVLGATRRKQTVTEVQPSISYYYKSTKLLQEISTNKRRASKAFPTSSTDGILLLRTKITAELFLSFASTAKELAAESHRSNTAQR